MLTIRDIGAIQPCQIPVRKFAGLSTVFFPSPGRQEERRNRAQRATKTAMIFGRIDSLLGSGF
jgi:hypothetical protein